MKLAGYPASAVIQHWCLSGYGIYGPSRYWIFRRRPDLKKRPGIRSIPTRNHGNEYKWSGKLVRRIYVSAAKHTLRNWILKEDPLLSTILPNSPLWRCLTSLSLDTYWVSFARKESCGFNFPFSAKHNFRVWIPNIRTLQKCNTENFSIKKKIYQIFFFFKILDLDKDR